MYGMPWEDGRARGRDNAELSRGSVSWCPGGGIGLGLAFGMVSRILIFAHWEKWTGQETGGREDRAF